MDFHEVAELGSAEIRADWQAICEAAFDFEEMEQVQRIVAKVCSQQLELYDAGKKIESLNPDLSYVFPRFVLNFLQIFQNLPEHRKTYANALLFLKLVDNNSKPDQEPIDFSNLHDISSLIDTAGNILLKDLLENALKLYPNDGKSRKIGARDILDGVVMSGGADGLKFKEEAFLKLKHKLFHLCSSQNVAIPEFEKKLFENEKEGITLYPNLIGIPDQD